MMADAEEEKQFGELLSGAPEEIGTHAPSSLKARLYSALVAEQKTSGPLASLDETVAAGFDICVFEKLVQIAPLGERAKSHFFCQVCHARVLGETFDNPPIYWPHCPYVAFKSWPQKRSTNPKRF
jgi:hypothetical protein